MKQNRKETAWKKSRKFGDVKGGRTRPKIVDKVFNRQHSFSVPNENENTPIYIVDNSSRDMYFPVTIEDIKIFLNTLPKSLSDNLTHIWLRKMTNKEYGKEGNVQGCFICGSGVNLIILYPFPKDLKMIFGNKKPTNKILKWYAPYKPELVRQNNNWALKWTEENIKKYYLEGLLLHEIGHQIDSVYKRYWSKNYKKRAESFADNFAFYWGNQIRNEIE